MTSLLSLTPKGHIVEAFGPFRFALDLTADQKSLDFPVATWSLGSLPLPRRLAPASVSREVQDEAGRFCFDVRLSLPVFGLLVHYRGWLEPQSP